MKKGQGIKGRQQQPKKPMAQRRVAPPHSSSESSEEEEGVEEEEGDNQVRHAIVCPQQEVMVGVNGKVITLSPHATHKLVNWPSVIVVYYVLPLPHHANAL